MIESIPNPHDALLKNLSKDFASYFTRDTKYGSDVFESRAKTSEGLKAEITLKPEHGRWCLYLSQQQDPHYETLVVSDIWNFSMTKKIEQEIKEYLRIHGIELVREQKEG